jgi:hypothetical protein
MVTKCRTDTASKNVRRHAFEETVQEVALKPYVSVGLSPALLGVEQVDIRILQKRRKFPKMRVALNHPI